MVIGALLGTSAAVAIVSVPLALRRKAKAVDPTQITETGGKWIRRPDGRLLEYHVIGEPGARLTIYAASSYSASATFWELGFLRQWCKQNNAKIIGVSMPGFGLSDSYPVGVKRSLLEWGTDVLAIMDQEQVQDFYIFGVSTGCAHGCAVANAAPSRVLGMVLGTPTAPASVEKVVGGISPTTAMAKKLFGTPYIGDLLAYALARFTDGASKFRGAPDFEAACKKMESLGGEHAETIQEVYADANHCAIHTYRGYCDNMHTIVEELPFDLTSLCSLPQKGIRIGITSAPDDISNPPGFQEWFHSQIKGSTLLQVEPGWGHAHFVVPGIMERILDYLITGKW